MRSGDIVTWVLFAVIMIVFYIGLKHIYRNFVSGESDCCKGGGCPSCAACTKEETTAKERENAANAWKTIRKEARQKKKYACPACEARARQQKK